MSRKYTGETMGVASLIGDDDKVLSLWHVVKRLGVYTMVPFGDLSVTAFGAVISSERIIKTKSTFKIKHEDVFYEIEPCGEGKVKAPRCSQENLEKVEILLGDSFLFALLLFSDNDDVEDESKSVVLLKDALRKYPPLSEIVHQKLNILLKPMEISIFDINYDEFATFLKAPKSSIYAYSEKNYIVPSTFAAPNFDKDYFFPITEFVGPLRPSTLSKNYGLWLGDFLDYKRKDAPMMYKEEKKEEDEEEKDEEEKKEEDEEEKKEEDEEEKEEEDEEEKKEEDEEEKKEEEKKEEDKEEEEKKEEEKEDVPSDKSKADLLERLKFDIVQKFPEFVYISEIEQFPNMSKKELEDTIHSTQKKLQEERDKLGAHKRKRTVCFAIFSARFSKHN